MVSQSNKKKEKKNSTSYAASEIVDIESFVPRKKQLHDLNS